jgi:hypothetical protein
VSLLKHVHQHFGYDARSGIRVSAASNTGARVVIRSLERVKQQKLPERGPVINRLSTSSLCCKMNQCSIKPVQHQNGWFLREMAFDSPMLPNCSQGEVTVTVRKENCHQVRPHGVMLRHLAVRVCRK